MKGHTTRCADKHKLPCEIIINIVRDITEEYELPSISAQSLHDACDSGRAVYVFNENGSIWVDCDYIAWEPVGQDICYAYVTRSHIQTERRSFRDASRQRHENVCLPEDIEAAFRHAEQEMSCQDAFWVDDFYCDLLNISEEKRG